MMLAFETERVVILAILYPYKIEGFCSCGMFNLESVCFKIFN